jgi:hypothetical protein
MAVPITNNRKHKDEEEIFLKTISTRIGGGTRLKSTSPTVSISEELKLLYIEIFN